MRSSGGKLFARIAFAWLAVSAAAAIILPGAAGAASGPPTLSLNVGQQAGLLDKVTASGVLPDPVPGDVVSIEVEASGNTVEKKQVAPGPDGSFSFTFEVTACCDYVVSATNAGQSVVQKFSVEVPRHLPKGPLARLFNQKLIAAGYYTGGHAASRLSRGSRLAIVAFRKVNGMARNFSYKPEIFRMLLEGKGSFEPRYRQGRHVEVDLSKQVMALVDGDRVVATFHISSGKPSTPTVRGTYRFYRKQPGTNSKGMFMSVYFIRGYAIHGYPEVPTHRAASHGCIRNPKPFSVYIYNWVKLGDRIHVYR